MNVNAALLWLVYLWIRRKEDPALYLGLTKAYLFRGMAMACLVGILIILFSAGNIFGAVNKPALFIIERFLWYFICIGFIEELFYRGFVQTTLERLFGQTWGLFLASWFMGATHIAQRIFLRGVDLNNALLQGLVLIPLTTIAIGYLFQRTRNIFPAAVAHGLIDFLPTVFR